MTQAEFARQVEQLQGTLYRIAATVLPQLCDREDAVQSAILNAWRRLPTLREDERFQPWLIRIMLKNISPSGKVSNDFSLFRRLCCINRCFRCSCGKFSIVHGAQAAIGFPAAAIGEKRDLPETHPVQPRTESRRPCRSTRAKPASKGLGRALSV